MRNTNLWRVGMARAWGLLLAIAVVGVASSAQAQEFARRIGFGNSPGYFGPQPVMYDAGCARGQCWPLNTLERGCCDIPANWRTHVWDDYSREPIAQRWAGGSLKPVAAVPTPGRTIYKRNQGDYGGNNCPNCRPNPAAAQLFATPTFVAPAPSIETAVETAVEPVARAQVARPAVSAARPRQDRST